MLLSKILGKSDALATKHSGYRISEANGGGWLSGGTESAAGAKVDSDSAMSLSAVFAGVNLLSRVIGALPRVVNRLSGRERMPAVSHPAYRLLHSQPNPEMTAATFGRTLEFNRLLFGMGCAEIQWAGNGNPAALWPVEGWRVRPARDEGGNLHYVVDGRRKVAVGDMIAVPLVSADGVCGRSFVEFAIESLGLGLSTQEFAARYFGSGARPGVILKHPGNPTDEARRKFRQSWDERHQGPKQAGKTAVLWGGWDFAGTDGQFDPESSQLLEQRRFLTEEVARWLGIPPHLLRDLMRATFSNIEQQNIDFIVYSLGPTLVDYEQEYDRKLLSPPTLYSKHNVAALLRGDSASRSAFYHQLLNDGVLCINEVREMEDRNPVDGGDEHFVPLNMQTLADAVTAPTPEPAPAPPPAQSPPQPDPKAGAAMRGLLASTLLRMLKVEANAIRRAAAKPGRFLGAVDEFYGSYTATLAEAIAPVSAAAEQLGVALAVPAWCEQSRADLLSLADRVRPAELASAVETLIKQWEAERVQSNAC